MQQKKNVQSPASRKGLDGLPTTKKKLTSIVVRRGQSQVRLEVEPLPKGWTTRIQVCKLQPGYDPDLYQ